MTRRIKVRGVKKAEPNLHLYVLALIALAQELSGEDERPAAQAQKPEVLVQGDDAE